MIKHTTFHSAFIVCADETLRLLREVIRDNGEAIYEKTMYDEMMEIVSECAIGFDFCGGRSEAVIGAYKHLLEKVVAERSSVAIEKIGAKIDARDYYLRWYNKFVNERGISNIEKYMNKLINIERKNNIEKDGYVCVTRAGQPIKW